MVHFYTYIRGLFNRARDCQNSLYLQHKFWQALASARSVEQASDIIYKHWCFVYRMLWVLMFCLSVERGVGTRTTVRTGPPQPWPGRSPFTPTQPRSCTSPDQGRSIQALCCSFLGGRILCIFMYSAKKKKCVVQIDCARTTRGY